MICALCTRWYALDFWNRFVLNICFMFNLKGVHQFEYCAIKKTENNSAVSQNEFRSSTCDSTLESTWPRLRSRLDYDTDNMRWPRYLYNHKYKLSLPYCASAVHIYIESPSFELSLPPLASSTTVTPSTTSASQLSFLRRALAFQQRPR